MKNAAVPIPNSGVPTSSDGTVTAATAPATRFYRHRLPVRLMHWINVVCLTILLMSGLTIFNAHPALYWGHDSTFADPWVSITAAKSPAGLVRGTRIDGHPFDNNGGLGG